MCAVPLLAVESPGQGLDLARVGQPGLLHVQAHAAQHVGGVVQAPVEILRRKQPSLLQTIRTRWLCIHYAEGCQTARFALQSKYGKLFRPTTFWKQRLVT